MFFTSLHHADAMTSALFQPLVAILCQAIPIASIVKVEQARDFENFSLSISTCKGKSCCILLVIDISRKKYTALELLAARL